MASSKSMKAAMWDLRAEDVPKREVLVDEAALRQVQQGLMFFDRRSHVRRPGPGDEAPINKIPKVPVQMQVEIVRITRMKRLKLSRGPEQGGIEGTEARRLNPLPGGHGGPDFRGDAGKIQRPLFEMLVQIGALDPFHDLPGEGRGAAAGIGGVNLGRGHSPRADLREQMRFHVNVIVLLGTVLDPDKVVGAIDPGKEGEMVPLAGRGADDDLPVGVGRSQGSPDLRDHPRAVSREFLRAVEGRGPVALPVVNPAAGMGTHAAVTRTRIPACIERLNYGAEAAVFAVIRDEILDRINMFDRMELERRSYSHQEVKLALVIQS